MVWCGGGFYCEGEVELEECVFDEVFVVIDSDEIVVVMVYDLLVDGEIEFGIVLGEFGGEEWVEDGVNLVGWDVGIVVFDFEY